METCPVCGGREFKLDTDVKPGLPGYGWADDPSHGLSVQICVNCRTVPGTLIKGSKPEKERPQILLDPSGRPRCPRTGCPGVLCQGEPVVPGQSGYGWNERFLVCQACGSTYHPRSVRAPEPPSQPKGVPKKPWWLPIAPRPEVPVKAFSGPEPAALDEKEIAEFWRRERVEMLLLKRPTPSKRRFVLGAPAVAGKPETWRVRLDEDVLLRYHLMRGEGIELKDVFPDRGVSVEVWLGFLGARPGPVPAAGADAVRVCMCAGEKDLEGKSAVRTAERFLAPMEKAFRQVIAQGDDPPDRKLAEKLAKSAARIGKHLDAGNVQLAFKELSRVPGMATDLPALVVAARLAAPFTPFIAERIYRHVRPAGPVSVHLTRWPFSEY